MLHALVDCRAADVLSSEQLHAAAPASEAGAGVVAGAGAGKPSADVVVVEDSSESEEEVVHVSGGCSAAPPTHVPNARA